MLQSYGVVIITVEWLHILIYTRHSWPFSIEGSLTYHIYCDTWHPFVWSSPRTRDTHTCCRAFKIGAITTFFNDLGLSRAGFEHPTFGMRGERAHQLLILRLSWVVLPTKSLNFWHVQLLRTAIKHCWFFIVACDFRLILRSYPEDWWITLLHYIAKRLAEKHSLPILMFNVWRCAILVADQEKLKVVM